MRKNLVRKKRREASSTAWLGGPLVALCAVALYHVLIYDTASSYAAERFSLFPDMYQFTDASPLLGMCTRGKAIWSNYQFLCEHYKSSITSTMVPKYGRRMGVSWYLEKKCQREEDCPSLPAQRKATLLSIIVPFHNNWNLTCQCMYELVLGSSPYQTEIILIDDASSAEESRKVKHCASTMGRQYGTPISVYKNKQSIGFSFSCNKGASISKGFLLLFANNDMFVLNGAIPLLVETMSADPKTGLVGPMMIDEHHVQEMGGIVFNDGSAANGFRGTKEIPLEWMVTHRVDYVSGACVMIEKNLFTTLGGFDPAYGRGYYEDTDLAMAVRNKSMEVVIQPLAIVYHKEGNTFGAAQKQSLMAKNQQLFSQKWKDQLQYHLQPGASPQEAKRRLQRDTILWIDQTIPATYFDSGSQRTEQILHILQDFGYDISFLPILHAHYQESWSRALFTLRFSGINILENPAPASICKFRIVFVARPNTLMKIHKTLSECTETLVVYDTVDLHFVRLARHIFQTHGSLNNPTRTNLVNLAQCGSRTAISDLSNDKKKIRISMCVAKEGIDPSLINDNVLAQVIEAGTMFTWEIEKTQIAKQILVVSKTEYDVLQNLGVHEENLAIVSNIYDDYLFSAGLITAANNFRKRSGGIFVGSFQHPPNWDAIKIICQAASGIAKIDPSFVMHIVGSHEPPANILKMMSDEPSIQFHGWLDDADLKELYSKVLVAITPLLVGAGVKGKVCSAYLNSVPVIGTKISIEGLGLRDKESVLTAVTVQDIITHYMNLRRSPHLWENLVRNGLQQLHKQVSVTAARASLENVLSSL